jgi:glycine cleavage system H protein
MKFTDSHEWIEWEGKEIARVGITNYAQKELGDIVYVELPIVGKHVKAKQEVAVLESTKAAADIYSPVSGIILEVNAQLSIAPELINQSPEKEAWLYKIHLSNSNELELLMEQEEYEAMLKGKSFL